MIKTIIKISHGSYCKIQSVIPKAQNRLVHFQQDSYTKPSQTHTPNITALVLSVHN